MKFPRLLVFISCFNIMGLIKRRVAIAYGITTIRRRYVVLLGLFVLGYQSILFAIDKPGWSVDLSALNVPPNWIWHSDMESRYSRIGLQFSAADEVIISLFRQNRQIELATRSTPEKAGSVFVSLFIDKADGKLIRKSEWPVLGESGHLSQIIYGSRIQPLASGGYVGIINRRLQVMDSSLKVLYERSIDRPGQHDDWVYGLITSLSGPFFILKQSYNRFTARIEIIDSRTLEIVEQEEVKDLDIQDIWQDQILGIQENGPNNHIVKEKHIGGSWRSKGLKSGKYSQAKFTTSGIVLTGSLPEAPEFRRYWFSINDENSGDPVVLSKNESIVEIFPARQASVVAIEHTKLSGLRLFLDKFGVNWVVVYDLANNKVLLKTKAEEGVIGCALSSDGRHLAVLTQKKLEMYAVPGKVAAGE